MAFLDTLQKLLGDPSKKILAKFQPTVEKINALEAEFTKLSDKKLKEKTEEFRKRIAEGETVDDILPEAFAAVREAGRRTLSMRHFDVQLLGGIALHRGMISEMKTGEGKTLVATLALYLNALEGKGAHLVTVNDYLARRDASWMGPIFDALGMTVAAIGHELSLMFEPGAEEREVEIREHGIEATAQKVKIENMKEISRKEAYAADITYGTNNEFGFDYLRDNMATDLAQLVQRDLHYAIVDEVDSILVDEARTPLIISAPAEESADLYRRFAQLVPHLTENEDYNVDEKMKAVSLTDAGTIKMENLLGVSNIYEEGGQGLLLAHHLEQALKAEILFKKDRDYVVKEGQIIIVDEFTGRLMYGRRYSEGLHQAIEAKEQVEVKRESVTMATITFQNYFRMYKKLSGMTGTAQTEAEEFNKIYNLEVVSIPTNKTMVRQDQRDVVYKTFAAKMKAVVEEIKRRNELGQPVLVGTISIEKNEYLSELLKREGIAHNLLNAKHHEREAEIIAQAGKLGTVTVATNMAGRGVDIILGGNPPDSAEAEKVKELGGLLVIGSERHESRRIDNQLRGRSGRQGDPGSSQFFLSLEDDLMRIFGGDRLKSIMDTLRIPEDQPIVNSLVSRSIESAQKKVETHNYDIRKHVVQYDDVMNKQRESIYKRRKMVLEQKNLKEEIQNLITEELDLIVTAHCGEAASEWNLEEIIEQAAAIIGEEDKAAFSAKIREAKTVEEIKSTVLDWANSAYENREQNFGEEVMRTLERLVYLRTIDHLWIQHLDAIDHLREGIGLRGYGQRDPLVEYKSEAFRLWNNLQAAIRSETSHLIYKVAISVQPQPQPEVKKVEKETKSVRAEELEKAQFAGAPETQEEQPTMAEEQTTSSSSSVRVISRLEKERAKLSSPMANQMMSYSSSSSSTPTQPSPWKGEGEGEGSEKVGRNDPCPCGSGKKYKKCHGA